MKNVSIQIDGSLFPLSTQPDVALIYFLNQCAGYVSALNILTDGSVTVKIQKEPETKYERTFGERIVATFQWNGKFIRSLDAPISVPYSESDSKYIWKKLLDGLKVVIHTERLRLGDLANDLDGGLINHQSPVAP